MPRATRTAIVSVALVSVFVGLPGMAPAQDGEMSGATPVAPAPSGAWTSEQAAEVLDRTLRLRLAPDLSDLATAERATIERLLDAGDILHDLYERQRHAQIDEARAFIEAAGERRDEFSDLYRIFKGPIATTLDNRREPFVPVAPEVPGGNVYPWGIDKETFDAYLAEHPADRRSLLALRSVVREVTPENVERDLAVLDRRPALAVLHPRLRRELETLRAGSDSSGYYAVPYAVAYAEEIFQVYRLLLEASALIAADDPEFSAYLRSRARDFLASDYESGDASWVTGKFDRLNAQIGSYETYDDQLYGVKAFYSLSILVRNAAETERLRTALGDLQAIENALPYDRKKKVRSDIPVGVYSVVADFGQSRGTNTATILPNETEHARKYGRTILMRHNIMTNETLHGLQVERFRAALAPAHRDELTMQGQYQRTLWHEVGHYLGVDQTADGRSLATALQQYTDLYEEMKSDLVSLFATAKLTAAGHMTTDEFRGVQASGIRRVLQSSKPRREQPYQTMQLMQWNWFLDRKVLTFDAETGTMAIDYAAYPAAVEALLAELLSIMGEGSLDRAAAFVDRWATWDEALHGVIATKVRDSVDYQYSLVSYAALGE